MGFASRRQHNAFSLLFLKSRISGKSIQTIPKLIQLDTITTIEALQRSNNPLNDVDLSVNSELVFEHVIDFVLCLLHCVFSREFAEQGTLDVKVHNLIDTFLTGVNLKCTF